MDKFRKLGLFLLLLTAVTANIQLVGNGYEGVIVAIDADVDVNPDLLTILESILTNGSATLFGATKNQLYFKEFIIVLPENWPRMDHYDNALDLELDQADIIIDLPNEAVGFTPYVRQFTGCGLGGRFMHLTPTYILNDSVRERYGRPGKVITHEWAHLRYGVFDEYPTTFEEMFYAINNTWYPTRCSLEVTGWLRNIETLQFCQINVTTNRPEDNCRFSVHPDTPAVSSIMYGQQLDNVNEFCDNVFTAPDHLKHNIFANNRQNTYCSYLSAWEVMRLHQDFRSLSNQTSLPSDTDTQPRFRYVQAHPRKRVLVLDTSGSMAGDPLVGLRLAASNFILSTIETGGYLGIVGFSSRASMLWPLTQINSDLDREALVDALPSSAAGSTSIGSGLLLGLQVLNETEPSYSGSIILITDGKENAFPYINDITPAILQAGVVVHSLSYGQNADPKIANLSEITGGRASFYSGSKSSTALLDGLANTVTTGSSLMFSKNITISILTDANIVTPRNPLNETFYIDSTIGNDTTLTFSFTQTIKVVIESPDGPYNATNVKEFSRPGSSAMVLRVVLENNITPGLWSYKVTTNAHEVSVLINIQSKSRRQGQEILQIDSWLSQRKTITFTDTITLGVFAEVVRGKTPVVNASVIATVETPTSYVFDLVLLDNGIGTDVTKADGVYSASIIATDFSGNGRYNVKIKVVGTKEHTKVFVGGTISASGAAGLPILDFVDVNSNTEPLEDFQRVTTAGEFRLNDFTPLVKDGIPPGRIVDFSAKSYDANDHAATLEWTAVGGDMDRGQASEYIIYKSLDVNDIISNLTSATRIPKHHVRQGNLSSPSAANQREEFVIYLQELDDNNSTSVYLSISAMDEAGNIGESSNLAIVSDAKEVAFVSNSTGSSDSKSRLKFLFISVPVAFVFIAVLVITVLILKCGKSKKMTDASGMEA